MLCRRVMPNDGLKAAWAGMRDKSLSGMNYRVNTEGNKNCGKTKASFLHCAETLHVA